MSTANERGAAVSHIHLADAEHGFEVANDYEDVRTRSRGPRRSSKRTQRP